MNDAEIAARLGAKKTKFGTWSATCPMCGQQRAITLSKHNSGKTVCETNCHCTDDNAREALAAEAAIDPMDLLTAAEARKLSGNGGEPKPANEVDAIRTAKAAFQPRAVTLDDLDEKKIPPRPWMLGTILLQGHVTGIVGAGSIGKSLFILMGLVAIVTGRDLIGEKPHVTGNACYIAGDDDLDEIFRQLAAICIWFKISAAEIVGKLFVISMVAREPLVLVQPDGHGVVGEARANVIAVQDFIAEHDIVAAAFDPYADFGEGVRDVDNATLNLMARVAVKIAHRTRIGMMIAMHVAKSADDPTALYFGRGGTATTNKLRITLNVGTMTEEQAKEFGIAGEDARFWLGLYDGKTKFLVKDDKPRRWYRREQIVLSTLDALGVLVVGDLTKQPDITRAKAEEVFIEIVHRFQAGPHRAFTLANNSPRSLEKYLVNRQKLGKGAAKRVINDWEANGIIGEVEMGRSKSGGYPTGVKLIRRP